MQCCVAAELQIAVVQRRYRLTSWLHVTQVQKRKEEAEKERVEYNRVKAARAKAKAEEELAEKMRQLEDRQL